MITPSAIDDDLSYGVCVSYWDGLQAHPNPNLCRFFMFNIKHSPINSAAYGNPPVSCKVVSSQKNFWKIHVVSSYPIMLTILLISINPLLIQISLLFQKNKKKGRNNKRLKSVPYIFFAMHCRKRRLYATTLKLPL